MTGRSLELERERMAVALESIRTLISDHYPGAEFTVFDGDDPPGLYLRAIVDIDDTDDIVAIYLDRLVTFQVDDGLPIYVLSVRPRWRVVAMLDEARRRDRPTIAAGVA